jgi:hypothetical protein
MIRHLYLCDYKLNNQNKMRIYPTGLTGSQWSKLEKFSQKENANMLYYK